METSATPGTAARKVPKLSRSRSCPALTVSPDWRAASAAARWRSSSASGLAPGGGPGVGAGVQLDAVGAQIGRGVDRRRVGVHEQAHAASQVPKLGHQRRQSGGVAAQVPAVVARPLVLGVGHERGLGRSHAPQELHESGKAVAVGRLRALERVALDVQLRALVHQHRQRFGVCGAGVAPVGAGVERGTDGAGVDRDARQTQRVRARAAARVPHEGGLVEVDAEPGHRRVRKGGA